MPPKRRPAAAVVRRGVLRRPAGAPVAAERGWQTAGEVDSDTLLAWPWIHMKGRFWDEDVELIGKILEVKRRDSGREVTMKASGTPTESLLKALTGIPSRQLRVHLCGDPCEALVWDEAYVHCSQVREAQRPEVGWSQNLEAAAGKDEEDELKMLRTSVEELREKGKGVGSQPTKGKKREKSPGTSRDEKQKKKKKKKKESLDEDPGKERAREPFRLYRPGPKAGHPAEGQEESKKGGEAKSKQEERQQFLRLGDIVQLQPGECRRGGQGFVRAGYTHPEGVETMPWGPHDDYDRRGQGGVVDATGIGIRAYGRSSTPIGYAVRPADPYAVDEWTGRPRNPSLGSDAGPPIDRTSGCGSRPGSSTAQSPRGPLQGHETRVASAVGTRGPGEAIPLQYDRDHEGWQTGERGDEGDAKSELQRHIRKGERSLERLERQVRQRGEDWQGRKRKEGKERGEEEGSLAVQLARNRDSNLNLGGIGGGYGGEWLSGRATPREADGVQRNFGVERSPSGREARQPQGSGMVAESGSSTISSAPQFHEFTQEFVFERQPQPQSAGLHSEDTATMVDMQHMPTPPRRTMSEVFQCALGTLLCDDKMRSNMGEGKMDQQDFMPLPVPQANKTLAATIMAVNHLGGWKTRPPGEENVSDSQSLAVKNLSELVDRHGMWKIEDVSVNFEDFFKRKSVDYLGEEVKVGMTMNWQAIHDSFPQEVGCLELERFCRLGTLEYVVNFEDFLLPQQDWKYTKPPRVMVEKDGWWELCHGLIDQKVCEVMPIDQLCHAQGKPLLNGMFAVGKGEYKGGLETQRLIMNLIPVNTLCKPLAGDISTLPGIAGLSGFLLEAGEVVLLSSEDIRCFFYLFSVPEQWKRYLGFNKLVPSDLVPPRFGDRACVLVARVLPMGFVNSVSIAQHVHRNVIKWASMAGVGGEHEMRKDRPLSSGSRLYRIYIDNFDLLEKTEGRLADKIKGGVADAVAQVRDMYASMGLPRRPKKSVQRALQGEVQGAALDGEAGFAVPKPEKVQVYCKLADELIRRGQCTLRELQVVCGGFIYICMFRRALLCCLNEVFVHMQRFEGEAPVVRLGLPWQVKVELSRFIALVPLAQMDFRVPIDGVVTCSDASTQGGGACSSTGLSDYGRAALNAQVRGDVPEPDDLVQVLSVGLFDGIGALRVACDVLGLPMAGHVSIEKDPKGHRVVESFFPETEFFDDVVEFGAEQVAALALKYSNVGVVLVGAGPPCQGVSGLNVDRKGAVRDERSSLFVHVPRICELFRKGFPWAQVHELVENVASMSCEDRALMSQAFGRTPHKIDSKGICLCSRPRLYWVTWPVAEEQGVVIAQGDDTAWKRHDMIFLDAEVDSRAFLQKGWSLREGCTLPTFTTSRPRALPGRRPAGLDTCAAHELARWTEDSYRFPPYQYKDNHGLWSKKGGWRRPNVQERELIMGFPLDYTKTV